MSIPLLTDEEKARLRVKKLIAQVKMTTAEINLEKAVDELLAARAAYNAAFAQVIVHNAEKVVP